MTEEYLPWSRKYQPRETTQIIGQPDAVEKVLDHINNFKKGKALLLTGPPGTGRPICFASCHLAGERQPQSSGLV